MMVDFTKMPHRNKTYGGANGNKLCVVYDKKQYMIKFPSRANHNKAISYSNSCFSEYIGCHIFETVGIPVQKTLLGTYEVNGGRRLVVACEDVTEPGIVLQDFASLKNQVIDSESNGYGTSLDEVLYAIANQTAIDPVLVEERFWDMFVVDALIGNWDRHNGNWGFLYNTMTDKVTLAPVFDCGSSLYPQADEDLMSQVLSDVGARNHRIYNIPSSALMLGKTRISYFDLLSSCEYEGCNAALERVCPKIDLDQINQIIEGTPLLTETQIVFYETMLEERKEKILDYSIHKLHSLRQSIPEEDEPEL